MSLDFWFFEILAGIVGFLLTSVAFVMAHIFGFIFVLFCYLGGIELGGMIASSTTFLTFIFFRSLGLKLTIDRKGFVGLSFVFVLVSILVLLIDNVFIFSGQQPIACYIFGVDFPSLKRWL